MEFLSFAQTENALLDTERTEFYIQKMVIALPAMLLWVAIAEVAAIGKRQKEENELTIKRNKFYGHNQLTTNFIRN